jgi:hypothetical protein
MPSQDDRERERARSRHLRVGPFFKALLISVLIEFLVLIITGGALASSMMRHSALAPRPASEDLLANLCIIFHFPSILIVLPFGLFILAPLVQIALMTCILGFILRALGSRQHRALPFLS